MTDEPTDEPFDEPTDEPFDEPTDEPFEEPIDVGIGEPRSETAGEPVGIAPEAPDLPDATDAVRGRPAKVPPARRTHWGPRTRIAVASLALVAMMFLFVFPTRSYIAQKRQVGRAADAVEVLRAQNEVLARQAARLKTKSEIERLAREHFNMVLPGEQAYNVVDPPDTTTTTVP